MSSSKNLHWEAPRWDFVFLRSTISYSSAARVTATLSSVPSTVFRSATRPAAHTSAATCASTASRSGVSVTVASSTSVRKGRLASDFDRRIALTTSDATSDGKAARVVGDLTKAVGRGPRGRVDRRVVPPTPYLLGDEREEWCEQLLEGGQGDAKRMLSRTGPRPRPALRTPAP